MATFQFALKPLLLRVPSWFTIDSNSKICHFMGSLDFLSLYFYFYLTLDVVYASFVTSYQILPFFSFRLSAMFLFTVCKSLHSSSISLAEHATLVSSAYILLSIFPGISQSHQRIRKEGAQDTNPGEYRSELFIS